MIFEILLLLDFLFNYILSFRRQPPRTIHRTEICFDMTTDMHARDTLLHWMQLERSRAQRLGYQHSYSMFVKNFQSTNGSANNDDSSGQSPAQSKRWRSAAFAEARRRLHWTSIFTPCFRTIVALHDCTAVIACSHS